MLAGITKNFEVCPSLFEERAEGLSAPQTALVFATGKAEEVALRYPNSLVLGADTVVAIDGEILGKPKDEEDAKRVLRLLSGRRHDVFTGVCLCLGEKRYQRVVQTRVYFNELSEEVMIRYVQSKLPFDKAGSYGIQDGYPLVERIEGSYSNVVGLPVEEVRALIEEATGEKL